MISELMCVVIDAAAFVAAFTLVTGELPIVHVDTVGREVVGR